MKPAIWSLICGAAAATVALAADRTPAPLPPDEAVQSMRLPPGFRATVFAAEPDVVQPVSFCIDDRGRLLVAEALNYGEWQPTGKDRIVILEDRDGDGKTDSRKVFFEGLNYVTGIEVGFGGVWAMSPPSLYFIPDRDGDDEPDDEPQVLFDGFGYRESRHNLANGFTWGPDGWLYAGHGRTSPSDVGRPGTPPEQRVHSDGGVVRIHPTRLTFENFADGTTNPWGVDFDDFGQCFVSNCVNPHLFHVIQGAHYEPWRNRPSSLYAYDRIATIADHLHYPSNQPKAMRGETAETLAMGGGHAHCGTLVYLGDSFPPRYRNTVLMCNVHGRRVNHDLLRRQGSGYVASHAPDFMIAGDPWFMGVTLRTGPDGSVFVSDWSDTGECHTYKPERGTGRIFKISYGPARTASVDLAKCTTAELVDMQLHPNDWFVSHARRLLQERFARPAQREAAVQNASIRSALEAILDRHEESPRRLRALWALYVLGEIDEPGLLRLLDDRQEHLRAWAVQLLCEDLDPPSAALTKFVALAKNDPSPIVRLQLAAALQRLPRDQRLPIAAGLVRHAEDAADQNLPLMIWYGIEPLVPEQGAETLRLAAGGSIPRLREFVSRRLVEHAVAVKDPGSLEALAVVLAETPEESLRDILAGAREGLRGRKDLPLPAGWSAAYQRLMSSRHPEVRELTTVLSVIFGDPLALADLRRTLEDARVSVEQRKRALEALIEKGQADSAPMLQDLLTDSALRGIALRGLAAIPHADTPRRILATYHGLTTDEQQEAIATLTSRRKYAEALLDAMEQKLIPRGDISAFAARQLHALGNRQLSDRLRAVWGEVRDRSPQKQEDLTRYKQQLSAEVLQSADHSHGRLVFSKTCQQCHRMFGEGAQIGPDLTGSNRANLDYLLSNLVDPSAEISRDYRLSVVVTKAGRLLTGIIVENSPSRITVQAATERITLVQEDVEEITESKASMMPEGQLDRLTAEEVRDLIAYLGTAKQVPLPATQP